jgi:anthranilate phosphoribosyltransferase
MRMPFSLQFVLQLDLGSSTTSGDAIMCSRLRFVQQGSRASSSACGSADVLEAFGVNIELGPEVVAFA